MNDNIYFEAIKNFEKAKIFIASFFIFLNIVIIIFSIYYLKKKIKIIIVKLLYYMIIALFVIDIIVRILNVIKFPETVSTYLQKLFIILDNIQFYLIISFIDRALLNIQPSNRKNSANKISLFLLSFIFLFVTFPYFKYIKVSILFQKIICAIKYLIILYLINELNKYLSNQLNEMAVNFIKVFQEKYKILIAIIRTPVSIFISFEFYFIVKIFALFIENQLLIIYINMIFSIILESTKYYIFIILLIIIFIFNKIILSIRKSKTEEDMKFLDTLAPD